MSATYPGCSLHGYLDSPRCGQLQHSCLLGRLAPSSRLRAGPARRRRRLLRAERLCRPRRSAALLAEAFLAGRAARGLAAGGANPTFSGRAGLSAARPLPAPPRARRASLCKAGPGLRRDPRCSTSAWYSVVLI